MCDTKLRTLDARTEADVIISAIGSGCDFPLRVTGNSMQPFLKPSVDTVWLRKCVEPKIGQIILFKRANGTLILHRIRHIRRDGSVVVNGDAQTWTEIVPFERIIAYVTAVKRGDSTRDAESFKVKLRNAVWYPTRPLRPVIFKLHSILKKKKNNSGVQK